MLLKVFVSILLSVFSVSRLAAGTLEEIKAIQNARASDLPDLWHQYDEGSDFRDLVIKRWVEIDPKSFFANELSWKEFDRGWYFRGRFVGKSTTTTLKDHTTVREMLKSRIVPSFFGGLAEERPEAVMDLAKAEKKLSRPHASREIRDGFIRGLAELNPHAAVNFLDQHSPADWKTRYPKLTTGKDEPSWLFERGDPASLALARWVVFHPQEAIAFLSAGPQAALHPILIAILTLKSPGKIEQLYQGLPTGAQKRLIKEGIDLAMEKPGEIAKFLTMPSPDKIRDQGRFEHFLTRSSTIPPAQFRAWLTDHRLAHLQPGEIRLLRSLVKDRWAEDDPESLVRFQTSQFHRDFRIGLSAWWERDTAAATQYVKTQASGDLWNSFLLVVTPHDAKKSLSLYQSLAGKGPNFLKDRDEILLAIARKDREHFLAFALREEEQKEQFLTILAKAWLRADFPWTLKVLTKHQVNSFIQDSYFHPLSWEKVPFDFLHKMPASWKETLISSPTDFSRDGFRWLHAKSHPGLSPEELTSLQEVLTGNDAFWFGWKDIPKMKHLVERGDWLTDSTKRGLAHWVVIRAHHPEDHRDWVLSLPPHIRSGALEALDSFADDQQLEEYAPPALSDLRTLSDFLTKGSGLRFDTSTWTAAEITSFHEEIRKITPEDARRLFDSIVVDYLPWPIKASLIPKVLAAPDLNRLSAMRHLVKTTAESYANSQPAAAAAWAMTISPEPFRILAAGIVADRWKTQNAGEAKSWILTLPKTLQQRFGY